MLLAYHNNMTRIDIIQDLIEENDYQSYLEIGVRDGECFNEISVKVKIGVDPDHSSAATHKMTSDEFFSSTKETFDIIFIDGLHVAGQVYRDITNTLDHLNDEGTIVCHDMMPPNEVAQRPIREVEEWTGDGWKAWVRLRQTRSDLEMYVIPHDYGCGIIKKGKQGLLNLSVPVTFDNFRENMGKWLNIKQESLIG